MLQALVLAEKVLSIDGIAKNPKAKIAFLCDVDDRQAVKSKENFPSAKSTIKTFG